MNRLRTTLLSILMLVSVACGVDGSGSEDSPTVVVTTNILGDIVEEVAGGSVTVETIIGIGVDPHEYQPSAREVDRLRRADAIVLNGGGLEEGLVDVIVSARADGTPTFDALAVLESFDRSDETVVDGDSDDEAGGDEHDHDHDHDHDGVDPHFFVDPTLVAEVVEPLVEFLIANVEGVDEAVVRRSGSLYVERLMALDREIESQLAAIPPDRRLLLTNHDVLGPFADRYGFDVVGTVIPTGSTADGTSAAVLADLAELIESRQLPAVFVDTSASDDLATTLAGEVGGVAVIGLDTESLGGDGSGSESYIELMRANAARIATALG